MELSQLPYRAEYAKSGRSTCKICKSPIEKESLRLAVMVKSHRFDGMQPNWHHNSCFFGKFRPKDVADISHFESLRWEDQELIRKKIASGINLGSSDISKNGKSSKSKKRNQQEANGIPADLGDYTVEYAKSRRSKCKVCEDFIEKNEVRISKKDYENEIAVQHGPTERWHHVDCFIKAREELQFFGSASIIPGFKSLTEEDQKMLKSKIPEIQRNESTDGPSPPKKQKEEPINKKLKKQSEIMFTYRDELQKLNKKELTSLMEYNAQDIPQGVSKILDTLSDAMAFGALKKCEKCSGQLAFRSGVGYQCVGYINSWTKCEAIYTKPNRVAFKPPPELKEKYSFLMNYKEKVSERLFTQTLSPQKAPSAKHSAARKSVLSGLKFFIHKTDSKTSGDLKAQVEDLGGVIVKKWDDDIFAVISTRAEVEKSKLSKNLKTAKDSEIYVLPENCFEDITVLTSKEELISKLNERKISPWGADPSKKIEKMEISKSECDLPSKSVYPKSKSQKFKSNETVKKITVKDGLIVDPDSKLEKVAHVYRRGDEIFSVVLNLTDVQTDRNSYYKLQILESDKKNKYWLFRAWGRIGTTIGGTKVEQYSTLNECIEIFKDLFEEKTGNLWESRKNFAKKPGKMMLLDIQYKDEIKEMEHLKQLKLESEFLSKSVQELISLIFDVKAMEKTMMEFELDLNKMPLGKLSQKQIQKAFGVLSELQNLIDSGGENHLFIEKSNIFYTLVPHDFGINTPPLLDTLEKIKLKIDVLNSLKDIEIAYTMLQECENSGNSIDEHYKKLNTEITDLSRDSEEFEIIERYVKNTHAKTHMNYSLEIENGLRIAPPEAPSTGYMFGKGIYFADMVSKSANYCNTSKKNPTGLLLLCEVALGEMHELTQAEYIETLPSGKNSVKGVGKTHPDPSEKAVTPTGAEVPLGQGKETQIKNSALLYNEYIVYNEAQVKIQYLLRLKFKHKI